MSFARPVSSAEMGRLLFVCTGNATRSVIAEALVRRERPEWSVTSAGTLAIPGLPSSRRTLAALAAVGVSAPGHRSRTLTAAHCAEADLIVAFELDHVRMIRRWHPEAAPRTATLKHLASLTDTRWPPVELDVLALDDSMETPDPAGGEVEDFVACAQSIDADLRALLVLLDRGLG